MTDSIVAVTSKGEATIHISRGEKGETILQWVSRGRVTDTVVILDEQKLYTLMRARAVDNLLSFTDFRKMLMKVHGFSTNKIAAIFNYIGLSPKFRTRMHKGVMRYGRQKHNEWFIEFLSDESYDEEYWRGYWRKFDKKILGVLRSE